MNELKAKIDLLTWLLERECGCDKSRCAEHFLYMKQLLYEYKCKYEEGSINDTPEDADGGTED